MGIEVAWNTVNIKNLPKDEKKRIMNEVRLLQNLEHKNLVQFHGSWVNREREEVIFVTEIMQSGSLMDFIRKVEMIRWRVVKRWARQILRGMHYLHSQEPPIIHRDLKCDNIFINGAAGDIRIGDLGLSTSNTRSEKTMSVLGTPEFMAPELYEEFYTEKVDIYAFGMCMLEMVTKERPYSECVNAAQIYRKVTSQILPSALDRVQNIRAREFIRVCLSPDPDDRPSAMDLLNLPFLRDKNEEEDNTLVMLEPLAAEGAGGQIPASTAGVPLVAQGMDLNVPAKIDPLLPGVLHPAQRGTPGLDTIDETVTPSAHAQQQAGGGGAPAAAAASQAKVSNFFPPTAGPSQGDSGGGGGSSVAPGGGDGDTGTPSRRPSYAAALMSDPTGGEIGGEAGAGAAAAAGSGEQGGDAKPVEGNPPLQGAAGGSAEVSVLEPEEAPQTGGRKIPGNPPFESDDDEDEQENDISHPEGFLRAMPEDESSMRVLQLPDGRVQRREEEDEEEEEKAAGVAAAAVTAAAAVSGGTPSDDAETVASVQVAPSSAQTPPLTSGAPVSSPAEVVAVAAAAPTGQAPRPPTAAPAAQAPRPPTAAPTGQAPRPPIAAPAGQAPRPPTADPAVFYSAGGRQRPGSGAVSPEMMFPTVGGGNDPSAAASANGGLLSDPGFFASLPLGPAVGLQRARSFSPLDHPPEVSLHSVASMPPMVPAPTAPAPTSPLTSPPMTPASTVPAPSFPSPRPQGGSLQYAEKQAPRADGGAQPQEVTSNANGPGVASGEGENPPVSAQQSDQELQDMLSGRAAGSAGRCLTEIKIANLQGSEQEIMRLVMHTHIEGRLQEVEFDFNLDTDHPKQVSAEMIKELGLSDEELGQISLTITNLAEKARRRRIRRVSSNSSGLVGQMVDSNAGSTLPWTGSDTNITSGTHRGSQGSCVGDGATVGISEAADNDNGVGYLGGGVDKVCSDDDLGIEDDDEFQKKKAVHDKKKRQAEKVYEARLAALLAARNDRQDEHKRALERYKKDCEEFDKKVEKLRGEKERRMEECLGELRGLEDGYRQKHRDAKQAKRQGAAPGNIAAQVNLLSVGQPPVEAAPTPQGYAQQRQAMIQGQNQSHGQGMKEAAVGQDGGQVPVMGSSRPRNAEIDGVAEDVQGGGAGGGMSDQKKQPLNLSQFNSNEGQVTGTHRSGGLHEVAAAASKQSSGNPPTIEEEEAAKRDRLSTL
ncbi:conserved unknown protein [Ectocarpus siliculosus]|uniref:Protein kinase domain-containing protein n=1 Tax=Ectocarpus siliculosus TaxID=2880 RepID=D7FR50_ECTSI|nr:conserved unknown protein [Ectocarpus siliculosus]|eukprot:CBJ26117.1 conserved unknown protein [Ectocarpus siliculosus]